MATRISTVIVAPVGKPVEVHDREWRNEEERSEIYNVLVGTCDALHIGGDFFFHYSGCERFSEKSQEERRANENCGFLGDVAIVRRKENILPMDDQQKKKCVEYLGWLRAFGKHFDPHALGTVMRAKFAGRQVSQFQRITEREYWATIEGGEADSPFGSAMRADLWERAGNEWRAQLHFTGGNEELPDVEALVKKHNCTLLAYYSCTLLGALGFSIELQFKTNEAAMICHREYQALCRSWKAAKKKKKR